MTVNYTIAAIEKTVWLRNVESSVILLILHPLFQPKFYLRYYLHLNLE